MNVRLLTLLAVIAAALWAVAPASAGASEGEGPAVAQAELRQSSDEELAPGEPEPEDPEPIPDFWSEEEPVSGGSSSDDTRPSSSSDQTSTSPGGTTPGSGTQTTGSGAPAAPQTAPPQQAGEPAEEGAGCDPRAALRRGLQSLRRALRGRNLLATDPLPVFVRVSPCVPGTFELAVLLQGTDTVLWRARRLLRTDRRATLRLTMTAAGRRFVARASRGPSRIVRMRLRARLAPLDRG